MTFTPAGNVQWITLWKPSHHLHQSPFPSQRKVQWHPGAEKHQLAHYRTAWVQGAQFMPFGPQLSYHKSAALLALCFPMKMDHVHCVPSTSLPHCFILGTHTLNASHKTQPRKPWQKFYVGVQRASMPSLVTSLGPQPLLLLLPSLANTTPTVWHLVWTTSDPILKFFFKKKI